MRTPLPIVIGLLLILTRLLSPALAQDILAKDSKETTPLPAQKPLSGSGVEHRFWDKKNAWLLAGVAGARALDYASSRHFRNEGINERLLSNSLVDNRPLFAAVEVAGTAASIGVAYLFHRTGHHKLERWVSIIHISAGVGGSVRNYLLKPDQPPPPASTIGSLVGRVRSAT
ncbi:MAG: hypothetical protein LAN62_05820 [Acidobacteriia bacterium]|nr:hypothetical protein [Terriglobia bacterium]